MKFEKWQGLGNDFIILEDMDATAELAQKLCDRRFGIGADGLFSIKKSETCDIGWLFFNSDGSVPQMCGNGIRCFAKYVYEKGLIKSDMKSKKFTVETLAGVITPEILEGGFVRVDMGKPILDPAKIPVNVKDSKDFEIEGYRASAVSMGNPHCVIIAISDTAKLAREAGPKIEVSPLFPEKVNVEFIEIISKNKIILDVWERGCGITLACGTGACAAVVAGINKGLLDSKVQVKLPGGILEIEYYGESVFMSGDAKKVFSGSYAGQNSTVTVR